MTPMAKQRAVISLSEQLMTRIDMYCSRLQMTRSQVVDQAVEEFLKGKVPEFGQSQNKNNPGT